MSKRTKAYLAVFIALSVAGFIVLASYQYKRRGSDAINFTAGKKTGSELSEIHYTGTRAGRLVWELNADSAKIAQSQDITELDTVKAAFYAVSGSVYRLTAQEGRLKESDGFIDVGGGVVVVSDTGERFVTDKLRYTIKSREITSKGKVEVISKGMNVTGSGLIVEVEKDKFTLLKDVRAIIYDAVQ